MPHPSIAISGRDLLEVIGESDVWHDLITDTPTFADHDTGMTGGEFDAAIDAAERLIARSWYHTTWPDSVISPTWDNASYERFDTEESARISADHLWGTIGCPDITAGGEE